MGEIVGGGNFPSYFIGAVMESVERVLVTGIGVNHCSSGVNDGVMLLVESVSVRISIWSRGGHPRKCRGVHPRK